MNAIFEHFTCSLATRHVRRRLARVIPALGLALVAYSVVQRVRAKGLRRGGLDALLDLTPVVGQVKAVYDTLENSFSWPGVKPVRTGSHGPRAPMPPSSALVMRIKHSFGVVLTAWWSIA